MKRLVNGFLSLALVCLFSAPSYALSFGDFAPIPSAGAVTRQQEIPLLLAGGPITIGSTTISGGAAGGVLYDKGGTLGEFQGVTVSTGNLQKLNFGGTTAEIDVGGTKRWDYGVTSANVLTVSVNGGSYTYSNNTATYPGDLRIVAGNVNLGRSATTYSILGATASDQVTLWNHNATDAPLVQMGGTTASFPALKRSTTGLVVRLADDTADSFLEVSQVKMPSLPTGTPATYACFDAGGNLISSATAC